MASNYQYIGGADLDTIFKAIGDYRTGVDGVVPVSSTTHYIAAGADLTGRYAPTNGLGSAFNDLITYNVGYKVGASGPDLKTFFRDINCPDVELYGPTTVNAGSFPAGVGWTFTAHSPADTLTGVRFYVDGHGAGNWSSIPAGDYAGFAQWQDPFGNTSISNSAGTYTFVFQSMDNNHLVGSIYIFVTVV